MQIANGTVAVNHSPEDGFFPFGSPNTVRPARLVPTPKAMVIGVYPSAFHVSWTAPDVGETPCERCKGRVAALAVDVEPEVFWDGVADSWADAVNAWKIRPEVAFDAALHGTIGANPPSLNGASGVKLLRQYLAHIDGGLDPNHVAFTDVYPVFMIKRARNSEGGKTRQQGDAIGAEYDAIASMMGKSPCTLPDRVPPKQLPKIAAKRFGQQLKDDLRAVRAPLVVTLGVEVWNTLQLVDGIEVRHPSGNRFEGLYNEREYGSEGSIVIGDYEARWLPLVHPGLLRSTASVAKTRAFNPVVRSSHGWELLHAKWALRADQTSNWRLRPDQLR